MNRALVVDADAANRDAMTSLVEDAGFETTTAESVREAVARLDDTEFTLLVIAVELPDGGGLDVLDVVPDESPTEAVMVAKAANASVETAVAALRGGAVDYLTRPLDERRLRKILRDVRRTAGLRERVGELDRELRTLGRFEGMVGASPVMQEVYEMVGKVAPTDATVLILGETGTGKEEVARAVHRRSDRREKPFVPVNCGAIPKELLESELFGHEKGAFTGADRRRTGMFERAHGGTLFLDEITEMSTDLQVNLLRVLETMEFRRVGGDTLIPVDVRILAATNRDPQEAVREGLLREDLLFRLAVFPVTLPPLRERGGDVALLARTFLERQNEAANREQSFSGAALRALERHGWSGNVRELRNMVERASILAGDELRPEHLEFTVEAGPDGQAADAPAEAGEMVTIAEVERRHILTVLDRLDGDKKEAAKILGISLKTLYNRLKQYRES